MSQRKLPIGVQDFEKLIQEKCLYIDKTRYIHKLAHGNCFFLSRPRRFGKSLFLSSLKQYFLGNKEIFAGLEIEKLEEENPTAFDGVPWAKHPVIYIDLNSAVFDSTASLNELLESQLEISEEKYLGQKKSGSPAIRFANLIRAAHKATGRKAVVLVDEYDKPLLQAFENEKLFDEFRAALKGFYGVLKSEDASLRFSMLTGVTKFSKVSVWSDLNNLRDITTLEEFSEICGITEDELHSKFASEIETLALKNEMTISECYARLKKKYDGYHFAKKSCGLYNPFSLVNVLANCEFGDYWYQSGTPTFLVQEIKRNNFDLRKLINGVDADSASISEYSLGGANPIPILVQSGYLTIKGYDKEFGTYHLELPNEEVKYGFLRFLSNDYIGQQNAQSEFDIRCFVKDVRAGNVDAFMTRLKSIVASLPYPVGKEGRMAEMLEYNFQVAVYLAFTLMGQFVECEVHSIKGRADAIVQTSDAVFIFEFKTDDCAASALLQIEKSGYAQKYAACKKRIVKIGANFSTQKRELSEWTMG